MTAGPHDTRSARAALVAAEAEVAACEAALSRFDPGSDLSRLNAAGGSWVRVDSRLSDALRLAVRAREETGGRFDPTVLPALVAAGYDRSFEQLVERPPQRDSGWKAGGAIEVEADRVRLGAGVAVDLGGIGKGFAATRALEAMQRAWPALPGALVDLGGDIALWGDPPEGGPWRVAIADPRTPGATAGLLLLGRGAVATSGRDVRRFGPRGSLHHLIDPGTGEPAQPGPLVVTVVGIDAIAAEVHATAIAMCDADDAEAYVAARPTISAVYIPPVGTPVPLGGPPLASARVLLRAA